MLMPQNRHYGNMATLRAAFAMSVIDTLSM